MVGRLGNEHYFVFVCVRVDTVDAVNLFILSAARDCTKGRVREAKPGRSDAT